LDRKGRKVAGTTFEGFSISHAAILNGSTGVEEEFGDIYGVRSGTIAADTGNYDNTGDDYVLSSWFWLNFATVTVEAGYLPFKTIALLSGASLTSSGAGAGTTYEMGLWEEDSVNQPTRPMLIRVPSKDSDGAIRVMDFLLYKVIFGPINFTGPSYKSGLLLNYTGRAVISDKNEKGVTLAKRAIGRIVNRSA
jgi:hypothetical protein